MTDSFKLLSDRLSGHTDNSECGLCDTHLSPTAVVYDASETCYERLMDVYWREGPFVCKSCYKEYRTEKRAAHNKSLGEYE